MDGNTIKRTRKQKDKAKCTNGAPFFVRFSPAIEAKVRAGAEHHELTITAYLRLIVVKFLNDNPGAGIAISDTRQTGTSLYEEG